MSVQNEGDGLLQDAVASGDVPGVVAVATSRDGTIYEGGFGERVLGGGMAMTPDTVGWIASMTKALTGTAAMQLVERGKLDLDRPAARGRRLGRLRLAVVPDVSAASLEGFLGQNVARPATVATDGWSGYGGLAAAGYRHEPVNLSASWGDAALRLPAIHLVFSLAKRWLLGTHHGAVRAKHLPAYLDEFTFRFNRRTAKSISHRFARVVEHAVQLPPTTYRALVATPT